MPELKLPMHCMDSKLLSKAKEVKATSDKKELSRLLSTGKWKAVFESRKPEAKEFKRWVFSVIKELRQASGLEGFQVFRMMDKEHQKDAMRRLRDGLLDTPHS